MFSRLTRSVAIRGAINTVPIQLVPCNTKESPVFGPLRCIIFRGQDGEMESCLKEASDESLHVSSAGMDGDCRPMGCKWHDNGEGGRIPADRTALRELQRQPVQGDELCVF